MGLFDDNWEGPNVKPPVGRPPVPPIDKPPTVAQELAKDSALKRFLKAQVNVPYCFDPKCRVAVDLPVVVALSFTATVAIGLWILERLKPRVS
jgi:hypothetical protein